MALTKSERSEHNLHTLEFSVDAEKFNAAINRAYKKQVGKINVPGFRKGKAPKSIIEKMYGKGFFYEDAINDVLPEAYEAALAESGINPVSRPEFDIVSIDDNGVVLSAKLYVKPEVSVENYEGITVERTVLTATDAEVDEEIEMVRNRNSREIEVTDRAAENGDQVNINYAGFCDGVAFDGGTAENQPLTLGSGQFIPGFEEQIVGKNIGDEFDVNVTFPEEYHAAELAGKAAVFKVKLNSINKVELPALDDEFAKDVSEFDTLDEYKADLKAKIQKRHDEKAETEVKDSIANALMDKLVADIPEAMFETETENFVRDYDTRLRMSGLDLNMYLQYTGMDLDGLRKQMRPQAERQVKTRLALEKIAELENIVVSDEDLNAELERIAEGNKLTVDQVKEYVGEEAVRDDLKVQRALDAVIAKAVITDKAPEADEKKTAKKAPAKKKTTTTKKTAAKKAEAPAEEATAEEKAPDAE